MNQFEDEVIENDIPAAELARGDTKAAFDSFLAELKPLRERAEKIKVTSIDQTKQMADARGLRLMIRQIRIMVENKRKDMVADYKRKASEIDARARILRSTCETYEANLEECEKFAEREEEKRRIAVAETRKAALIALGVADTSAYNLEVMSEQAFIELNGGLIVAGENKRKEAKELADKQAREKAESERVLAENRRLREEAARVNAAKLAEANKAAQERQRVEAEHQRTLRVEREKHGAKLAALVAEKKAIEAAAPAMREALRKIIAINKKPTSYLAIEDSTGAHGFNSALALCQEIAKAGLNDVPVAVFEEFEEESK